MASSNLLPPTQNFIPENLYDDPLFPKIAEMVDHIIDGINEEFGDVLNKYAAPECLDEEAVKERVIELGYDYLVEVMDTIENFEFNQLLSYTSMIAFLKGSREGLELVLRLLGMDSFITEWWQQEPKGEPHTYDILVLMDSSLIPDVFVTLEKIQIFTKAYVYPTINNITFQFSLDSFAETAPIMGGFEFQTHVGFIRARAFPQP